MTIALYARRKGWPLRGVTVRLRHSRIHADDCAECETKQGLLDRIESEIALDGALDEEQRTRAVEIAEKCRGRRTLGWETNMGTRRVGGGPPTPGPPPAVTVSLLIRMLREAFEG